MKKPIINYPSEEKYYFAVFNYEKNNFNKNGIKLYLL